MDKIPPAMATLLLTRFRLELWSAAQRLDGDDLREFWTMIYELWESREALLIGSGVTDEAIKAGAS